MRVDPAIAGLRRTPALQRRAQAAMIAAREAWRRDPCVMTVWAELERFGSDEPIASCPALDAVFAGPDAAPGLVATLCRRFAALLVSEPFGHPPFRHGFDGQISTLLLGRAGRAQLILHAREPSRHDHATAEFSHAQRYEAILAGSAHARVVRMAGGPTNASFTTEAVRLAAGTRLVLDLSCEALQTLRVERRLVSLRLHRFGVAPGPSREYRLADGALLRQSAGDIRVSRQEIMLALLGRMERREAAPEMAALACGAGDGSLRWQALRECLALDTAAGFRALSAIARAAGDPLAAPAGALRARLIEAHPQLRALGGEPCRA